MNRLSKILLPFLIFFAATVEAQMPPRPQPPVLVNDGLQLLTAVQRAEIEKKLVDFDKRSSTQIVVYTTNDLKGMDAGDYATELLRAWGVGNKKFDNGVVLLIYKNKENTSRKVFITTGYGLEGVLPDYTCSEIVDNELRPFLKQEQYFAAINNSTDAIIKATEGKYKAPDGYYAGKGGMSLFKIIFVIFIILIILSIISKGGGSSGGYMSRRGYRNWNGPTWFPIDIGGSSGGGGWSGGGGGGFGGFGGGSGGGGGAGGDW